MSRLGHNVKLTVDRKHQPAIRGMFAEILGAKVVDPQPDLQVYALADTNIGVYYVDGGALTPEQQARGAWLEILVDDPEATRDALLKQGLEQLSYVDTGHHYFSAPGGWVFRLA